MVNLLHKVLLGKLGYRDNVKTFTDPRMALEDLRREGEPVPPTLILLDINMPEMSGFEFLDRMVCEGFPQNLDVIVVTSSIAESDRAAARNYPGYVKDFVVKPLKIERLRTLIKPV